MGEHFFFEKEISNPMEIEDERVIVRVYDHETIGADSLIG